MAALRVTPGRIFSGMTGQRAARSTFVNISRIAAHSKWRARPFPSVGFENNNEEGPCLCILRVRLFSIFETN